MTMKLVDPVHFFDQRGLSILSNDMLRERLEQSERENVRLRELLITIKNKNDRLVQQIASAQPAAMTLN